MQAALDLTHDVVLPILIPVAVTVIVGLPVLGWRIFRIWNYLQQQMSPEAKKSRPATTEGMPLRDALDVNTSSTQRLESRVAMLGAKLSELRDEFQSSSDRFAEHIEWANSEGRRLDEVEQRQRDLIMWGLRNFTELRATIQAVGLEPPASPDEPEGD